MTVSAKPSGPLGVNHWALAMTLCFPGSVELRAYDGHFSFVFAAASSVSPRSTSTPFSLTARRHTTLGENPDLCSCAALSPGPVSAQLLLLTPPASAFQQRSGGGPRPSLSSFEHPR